jgi:toxin ParE1/3/4
MDYKVVWDDEATAELGQIVRYIAQFDPDAARKTGLSIFQKVKLLGSFPQLGKIYRQLNREDVREIPVYPYRVIYLVKDSENSVRILKVWHGARRDPEIK